MTDSNKNILQLNLHQVYATLRDVIPQFYLLRNFAIFFKIPFFYSAEV